MTQMRDGDIVDLDIMNLATVAKRKDYYVQLMKSVICGVALNETPHRSPPMQLWCLEGQAVHF